MACRCAYKIIQKENDIVENINKEIKNTKPMTFGDRIRSMTDEELAIMFYNTVTYVEDNQRIIEITVDGDYDILRAYYSSIKKWLKTEIPEERRN